MITDRTLDETLVELLRCQRALEALRAKRTTVSHDHAGRKYLNLEWAQARECIKEHAAAKRASMDLTRKLAALRAGR